MSIRIIIAGTREFADYEKLVEITDSIIMKNVIDKNYNPNEIEIVCGMARGADLLGMKYGKERGYTVKCFPANWEVLGKYAGIMRNRQMGEYASEERGRGALIAFWNGRSRGTKNMIDIADELHLKTFIYNYENGVLDG